MTQLLSQDTNKLLNNVHIFMIFIVFVKLGFQMWRNIHIYSIIAGRIMGYIDI